MIFLSPGVKTREIDYSTYVGEVSSCIVGMVGAATKGPVGIPTLITSPSDFIDTFGEPTLLDYGAYCALEFLKQGNQLYYVRVGEDTLAAASATLSDGLITITAKEKGTYGNAFSVELTEGEIDEEDGVTQLYNLVIYRNDTQEESIQVSFDPTRDDWIENVDSYWVNAEYNEAAEIQPFIESFEGFTQNVNNKWEKHYLVGSSELNSITFDTNVNVAASQLKVVSDSRATGLPAGTVIGTSSVDGNNFTITGMNIEFPDTKIPGEGQTPVSQGTANENVDFGAKTGSVAAVSGTWTATGGSEESIVLSSAYDFGVSVPTSGKATSAVVVDAIKSDFVTWLATLGFTDSTNTPIDNATLESSITITDGTLGTPVAGTMISTAPGTLISTDPKVMEYTETTPYTNVIEGTVIKCTLNNVYYDNTSSGTAVEGSVEISYKFDINDIYDSVETFKQTYSSDTDVPDAFTIEAKIELITETGLVSEENILICCVDSESDIPVVPGTDTEGATKDTDVEANVTPTETPVYLVGGLDGAPVSIQKVYKGVALFENTEDYDINLIAAPGRFETEIVTKLLEVAQNRADTLAIIDPPQGLSYKDMIAYHNGKLSGDAESHYPKSKLNTSYGAIFYPWVQVYDEYSGANVWLPPSGVVLGAFAYNDSVGQPWFAAAGLTRGMLSSVLDVETTLDEGKRDALYGNGNAVNTIVNYKQQGITIWGNRTLQRKTSALDRINVRRLMNLVRKSIAATSSYLIFEQNDELTWSQWKNQVDPYLESIKLSRGLYAYKTVMDATTVTDYYKDRNQMPGKVWLQPTKTAEFIPIDFILTSSGASFSD